LKGQAIGELDVSDQTFETVEQLDLSENQLSDIRGVYVFPNLSALNLEKNQISSPGVFFYLKNLPKLKEICLVQNPIEEFPFWKQLLVFLLPNIQFVNGEVNIYYLRPYEFV
jgi:Leucine-rich repeat (LRR) protein